METINHESYVSLDIAKLLKKAGFDWEVNHSYPDRDSLDNSCSGYMEDLPFYHNLNDGNYGGMSVPTIEVAQRWLREAKGFEIFVCFTKHDFGNGNEKAYFYNCYEIPENEDAFEYFEDVYYHTFEEALETGIKKALELILKKKIICQQEKDC
jgi:hypothetical protein